MRPSRTKGKASRTAAGRVMVVPSLFETFAEGGVQSGAFADAQKPTDQQMVDGLTVRPMPAVGELYSPSPCR
ncbi:hypothetical protein GCM10022235_83860 [Kribbella ginsengisoli]|uniref:Uncharacterized protein n=1 Tax=Kribbella ginsengisoli TaxID=363865 RepID=A0ABP6Z8I2_9ACTN